MIRFIKIIIQKYFKDKILKQAKPVIIKTTKCKFSRTVGRLAYMPQSLIHLTEYAKSHIARQVQSR